MDIVSTRILAKEIALAASPFVSVTAHALPGIDGKKLELIGSGVWGVSVFFISRDGLAIILESSGICTYTLASYTIELLFSSGLVVSSNMMPIVIPAGALKDLIALSGKDLLARPTIDKQELEIMLHINKRKTLLSLLSDSECFLGLGPELKSEILYRASLSPFKKCAIVLDSELSALYASLLAVPADLLYAKKHHTTGTSISYSVYNRNVDKLGNLVVREKSRYGEIFWAPAVQK